MRRPSPSGRVAPGPVANEPAAGRLHRLAAHARLAHHRAGPRHADRRALRRQRAGPTPSTSPSASRTCCAGCSPKARSRRPSCRSWPQTRAREGDEATRRLSTRSRRCCSGRCSLTCAIGIVGAPVHRLADGVGPRSGFDGAVRDDALDVPVHRLHVAGGAVGRHPEHLAALRGAGGDAGAAQPGDDRRRLVARAAVRSAGASSRSTRWRPA